MWREGRVGDEGRGTRRKKKKEEKEEGEQRDCMWTIKPKIYTMWLLYRTCWVALVLVAEKKMRSLLYAASTKNHFLIPKSNK